MSYIDCKSLLQNFDEKEFIQYATNNSIDIHGMVPKLIHDPEIDKFRKSESDYNFLDLSAYYGNYAAFNYFLDKVPFQIILNSSNNFHLIYYALIGKNKQIIKDLIKKGETNEIFFSLYYGIFYSLKIGDIIHLNEFFMKAIVLRPNNSKETILYDIFLASGHKPRSPLKIAVKSGNLGSVAFVLNISQKEIPYFIETKQGEQAKKNAITPLHIAARYNYGDLAYLLINLESKMLTEKGTHKYFLPFIDAIKYNSSPQRYEEYFKHEEKDKIINSTDNQGNGALHYAIKHNNINAVHLLLQESNIDVNLNGENDKTPIHLAAQSCNREILMELLNNPTIDLEKKDDNGNLAIHDAAEYNWAEGFLNITRRMATKRKEMCGLLQIISSIDNIIFTKNQMGLCCFHVAAIKNCAEIFDCIEKKYPMIASKIYEYQSGLTGYTVLHYLAMCGHSKLLEKILMNHPAIKIDIEGIDPIVSPLYLASHFNHENCVIVLIKHGANIQKLVKKQKDIKS